MTEDPATRARHAAPALGLWFLAPVTAEYLYGYDESTGNLEQLIGGLTVLTPLYGGAALIIREMTRRAGRGWATILLLGLGFGVMQAGLIDHSLFNASYRGIDYWDEMFDSSYLSALSVNPNLALVFTTGHMIWSVAAPIAIIEALAPRHRRTPWLGYFGHGAATTGFMLAAAFVVWWHLDQEDFVPSAGQLAAATTVVVALAVAAFTASRRLRSSIHRRTASPWVVGTTALVILAVPTVIGLALELVDVHTELWRHAESSWFLLRWPGFVGNLALLATLGVLLVRWSRPSGWGSSHQLAVAGGVLLANVVTAFVAEPIGDVSDTAKYAHNTIGLIGVLALLAIAAHRQHTDVDRIDAGPATKASSATDRAGHTSPRHDDALDPTSS